MANDIYNLDKCAREIADDVIRRAEAAAEADYWKYDRTFENVYEIILRKVECYIEDHLIKLNNAQ